MAMTRTKIQTFTPTTGKTITILNSDYDNVAVISPSGTLAALTITFPSNPHDGQNVCIFFNKSITALSWSGGTVNNSLASARIFSGVIYVYSQTSTTWVRNTPFNIPVYWDGVLHPNAFPASGSATTSSGIVTLPITDDGTLSGNALFSTVNKKTLTWWIDDTDQQYSVGSYTLAGNKKSFTLTVKYLTFSGVTILGITALGTRSQTLVPDGTVVNFQIFGE